MTASAVLFRAYFSPEYSDAPVQYAGLWLSFVFLVCEIVLSYTMARQHKVAREIAGEDRKIFQHRHWLALWSIRVLIPSIYILVGIYWWILLRC